jgi:hypothetical protein
VTAGTHSLTFGGGILERGFWLYVWEVKVTDGRTLHYVGRTGDSSSRFAQSPYIRMGQHLGTAKTTSMLRKHLVRHGVTHGDCIYRLVAHGPVLAEAPDLEGHRERRDVVAALEKALAEAMADAGCLVMNTVKCRKPLDAAMFAQVRAAFAAEFPRLSKREHL